jgi:hypothetical protein
MTFRISQHSIPNATRAASPRQLERINRAADIDSNGNVDYDEFGAAGGALSMHAAPGAIARTLEARKALLERTLAAVDGNETYDQAVARGVSAPYFRGFFSGSQHTLRDEIRQVAFGLSDTKLKQLSDIVNSNKGDQGRVTWKEWANAVYPAINGVLAEPRRLLHGSAWGNL